jgi:hypothetical protein
MYSSTPLNRERSLNSSQANDQIFSPVSVYEKNSHLFPFSDARKISFHARTRRFFSFDEIRRTQLGGGC